METSVACQAQAVLHMSLPHEIDSSIVPTFQSKKQVQSLALNRVVRRGGARSLSPPDQRSTSLNLPH